MKPTVRNDLESSTIFHLNIDRNIDSLKDSIRIICRMLCTNVFINTQNLTWHI